MDAKKKRKKSYIGYTLKNWGFIKPQEGYIVHDFIYPKKDSIANTKVKITIEEI